LLPSFPPSLSLSLHLHSHCSYLLLVLTPFASLSFSRFYSEDGLRAATEGLSDEQTFNFLFLMMKFVLMVWLGSISASSLLCGRGRVTLPLILHCTYIYTSCHMHNRTFLYLWFHTTSSFIRSFAYFPVFFRLLPNSTSSCIPVTRIFSPSATPYSYLYSTQQTPHHAYHTPT
jgi:hypothetical protein